MKALYRISLALSVFALIMVIASFAAPGYYAGKARLIQRVKPHDPAMAELTGEVGAFIGPPEQMIVEDPRAFLKGTGEGGALLVNDDYMQANGVYPLQLKSVEAVATYARVASAAALVVLGLAAFLLRRKLA